VAGCRLAFDLRDAQSQGSVAVDQARQLVDLRKVPAIIGGIISSVSIPIVTSVTAPAGVVQDLARLDLADPHAPGQRGQDRRLRSSAPSRATRCRARLPPSSPSTRACATSPIIHVNNDFGVNMLAEFRRAYEALGGKIESVTPYNPQQPQLRRRGHERPEGQRTGAVLHRLPRRRHHHRAAPGSSRAARSASCSTTA
jgi:branched-chain amino acid transport system substrate-binding protein